jgi:queuine tRNA-ribosyltransferase
MNWPKPILTDSGGFQVFSLAKIRKVKEHGVEFRSHLDGSLLFPRSEGIHAHPARAGFGHRDGFRRMSAARRARREQRLAVERTIRWARECREQPRADGQKVFGIVQGGSDAALREQCAKALVAMDFDGYAIGGVSVGEPEPEMMKAVESPNRFCPRHKARYAMGLGTPAQMVELVARGVDMFDCVLPTRIARNGTAFTQPARSASRAGIFKTDFGPIEEGCECYACGKISRARICGIC